MRFSSSIDLGVHETSLEKPGSLSLLGLQENNGGNDRNPPDDLKEKEAFSQE